MTGPAPDVAAVRAAVRADLAPVLGATPGAMVLVACSGGPDSLALAAAAAFVVPRLGGQVRAVVVDHCLQPGSDRVAAVAAERCRALGVPAEVVRVAVVGSGEGAARDARYAALEAAADAHGAVAVLLGHTMDDQAEAVLLALGRGSGARSLAGIPPVRGRVRRPLLGVRRSATLGVCDALGLEPWHDPTNAPPHSNRRSAVRHDVLPALAAALGPGVVEALARTADQLRADAAVLDAAAQAVLAEARRPAPGTAADPAAVDTAVLDTAVLAAAPAALRTRAIRAALLGWGARAGSLAAVHVAAVDALVTDWHGQSGVSVPGVEVVRRCGRLMPSTVDDTGSRAGGRS